MARVNCPFETEVLELSVAGLWPSRASESLRTHAASCSVCRDLALVSVAIAEAAAETHAAPSLPGAGTVWWRAQIRARQDAVRQVARPITIAQAIVFAGCVGLVGAVFGATTGWFQGMLSRAGTFIAERVVGWDLPSLTAQSTTLIVVVALGLVISSGILFWAFREDS